MMRIPAHDTIATLIDMQEKLFPHMQEKDLLLQNSMKLIEGLKILNIPILITQQYTHGLGPTVQALMQMFPEFKFTEKIAFSCCDEPAFTEQITRLGRHHIILFGIEAHVCILQTCIDLLEAKLIPVVVEDCISSRKLIDKAVALRRMHQEGARITTFESLLFELTRRAGSETFKNISRIVR